MGPGMRCGEDVCEEWEEKKYRFSGEVLSNNFVCEAAALLKNSQGRRETLKGRRKRCLTAAEWGANTL